MSLKNYALIFLFFLSCTFVHSQSLPAQNSSNSKQNQTKYKYGPAQIQNMVGDLKHDTCLTKKFSIVFYLIQDSLFSLTSNPTSWSLYPLSAIIASLNAVFKPICVSFEHCKTVIIPNYSYNLWKGTATGNGTFVIQNWNTPNTINVYLPDEVLSLYPDDPDFGYATGPPNSPLISLTSNTIQAGNSIVFPKSASAATIMHAFGHFFGLQHTFYEINPLSIPNPPPPPTATPPVMSYEYANHSNLANCYSHGDGFCDTEADPFGSAPSYTTANSPFNCAPTGLRDGNGDFYTPPTDNYMSLYIDCRCRFSQEQYNYMAYIIQTRRLYLH